MKLSNGDFLSDLNRWHKAYKNNIIALSYAKNTLELYNRIIDLFILYSLHYKEEMQLVDIKSIYIIDYLAFLEKQAKQRANGLKKVDCLSKSTKQTYLKIIRSFFSFISSNNDEHYSFERFFKDIKIANASKMEEKLVYLTEDEIERLLNIIEKNKIKKDDYNSYRNSLLVKLMLYGGLRISEALNVSLDNFSSSQNKDMYNIKIYGKGGKEQIGFIVKEIIDDELDYFKIIAKLGKNDLIMKTEGNKQLNRASAYIIINRIYKRAEIKKNGLHLLRHTLAMRLTQKGVNLIVIKKILRHSSIVTTTIYAKATESTVANAMKIDLLS